MRKIFKSILVAVFIVGLGASNAYAQFEPAATIGVNLSNLKFRQDLFDIDQCVGFTAGVTAESNFPGVGFGMGTGIYYSMLGANLHLGQREVWKADGYGTERAMLHYVKIPLNLRFKWTRMSGLEDYVAPMVFAGPNVGFLVGHSHIPALKYAAADIGLEVGFGVEVLKKWQITASKNWGVTFATKTKVLDDFSARNRSWNLSVAYYWNRK